MSRVLFFSGKCLHVNEVTDGAKITVSDCGDNDIWEQATVNGSIQNPTSNDRPYCIHPNGGSATPCRTNHILLYNGCEGQRLNFRFLEREGAQPEVQQDFGCPEIDEPLKAKMKRFLNLARK